jgi:hypothetical protein
MGGLTTMPLPEYANYKEKKAANHARILKLRDETYAIEEDTIDHDSRTYLGSKTVKIVDIRACNDELNKLKALVDNMEELIKDVIKLYPEAAAIENIAADNPVEQ